MSKLSTSEQAGGNIKTPASNDNFQSNKWFGTYHLDEKNPINIVFERIEQHIIPLCSKYVFAEEYGKSGASPHIQFAFILKDKSRMRRTALQKLFGKNIFLDRMKGTIEQSAAYCSKECNKIITNVSKPKPLKPLACENNLYEWQKNIIEILNTEPDDRTIYWIHGPSGNNGKTTFCKYIHRFFKNVIMLSGKSADMKNGIIEFEKSTGCLPEIILINIPKSFNNEYLSYTGIEEVKDMFFYSGKYEGGMVNGNSPHVFIFSNTVPDLCKMSADRWNIIHIE